MLKNITVTCNLIQRFYINEKEKLTTKHLNLLKQKSQQKYKAIHVTVTHV